MKDIVKNWIAYSTEIDAFLYEISIPVNQDNWRRIILDFDLAFLKFGRKYGLFYYEYLIEKDYKERRMKSFFTNDWKGLSYLRFENYFSKTDFELSKNTFIDIPEYLDNGLVTSKKTKFDLHFYSQGNDILYYLSNDRPLFDELLNYNKWETNIHLSIISKSNIWWDEIGFTVGEEKAIKILLNPPANNRPWAYNITPRFNSFLRALKIKAIELGGIVHLDEGSYVKKYVTVDGILLDGKVVYAEDNIFYKTNKND